MALDSSTPLKAQGSVAILAFDGTGTPLTSSGIFTGKYGWTRSGVSHVESRSQGKHKSTPVVTQTTDGNCKITLEGEITSFEGSSNTHLIEALQTTGNAAAWVPTGDGDGKTFGLTFSLLESKASSPSTQTITFGVCTLDSMKVDVGVGDSDVVKFSATITAYTNDPVVA